VYYGRYETGPDNALMVWHDKYHRLYPHTIGSRPVPTGYLESMLFDLTEVGVNIKHVPNVQECAVWIGCLYRWWSKPWSKHEGLRKFDQSRAITLQPGMDPDTHLIASVANVIGGLGYKRAMKAAAHFRSVQSMVCASKKDWLEIDGIGPVLADSIVGQLNKQRKV
jgi:hypothetical protein